MPVRPQAEGEAAGLVPEQDEPAASLLAVAVADRLQRRRDVLVVHRQVVDEAGGLAVAQASPLASVLPGHALTAPSAGQGLRWTGCHHIGP